MREYYILIVDDNEDIHKAIKRAFQVEEDLSDDSDLFGDDDSSGTEPQRKLNFVSAFQGKEGYKIYAERLNTPEKIDLVICDMRMPPGISGFDTLKLISNENKNVLGFVCSAYSDYSMDQLKNDIDLANEIGWLEKPFKLDDLRELINVKLDMIDVMES